MGDPLCGCELADILDKAKAYLPDESIQVEIEGHGMMAMPSY